MSQADIIRVLREKGPMTTRQISDQIGAGVNSLYANMRRLIKHDEVVPCGKVRVNKTDATIWRLNE